MDMGTQQHITHAYQTMLSKVNKNDLTVCLRVIALIFFAPTHALKT